MSSFTIEAVTEAPEGPPAQPAAASTALRAVSTASMPSAVGAARVPAMGSRKVEAAHGLAAAAEQCGRQRAKLEPLPAAAAPLTSTEMANQAALERAVAKLKK